MKYKMQYLIFTILVILVSLAFENKAIPRNRFHQHIESHDKVDCINHGEEKFCTHLPLINISTDRAIPSPFLIDNNEKRIPNNEMVKANIQLFDQKTQNNHLTDEPVISENALIRIRGRSSRNFDKSGYLVKFKDNSFINSKKISLAGMTADSDWVLHGPYMDKTLLRNYLCYNLSGEIMEFSPNVRFCEIFLNGSYQGVYILTEKIEYNDNGRINITKTDPDLASTSYILQLDVGSENPLYALNTFSYYTGKNGAAASGSNKLEIIYPNLTLTPAQKKYIEYDISKFEKALVSFDSANKKWGYPAFIDIDSFVDYFIINEFTMNSDAAKLSTYYYKDLRGKMKIAVWDFNSSFDNYVPIMSNPHYFMMTDKFWYKYLLKDSTFVDKVIERYSQLRQTYLSDAYLLKYVDDTVAYLGKAVERNYRVWGYSFTSEYDLLKPSQRNPRTYDEAVKQLTKTIVDRGAFMDNNIKSLKALSHDSVNKQFKNKAGQNK